MEHPSSFMSICNVPYDAWCRIFQYLSKEDLAECLVTCKEMQTYIIPSLYANLGEDCHPIHIDKYGEFVKKLDLDSDTVCDEYVKYLLEHAVNLEELKLKMKGTIIDLEVLIPRITSPQLHTLILDCIRLKRSTDDVHCLDPFIFSTLTPTCKIELHIVADDLGDKIAFSILEGGRILHNLLVANFVSEFPHALPEKSFDFISQSNSPTLKILSFLECYIQKEKLLRLNTLSMSFTMTCIRFEKCNFDVIEWIPSFIQSFTKLKELHLIDCSIPSSFVDALPVTLKRLTITNELPIMARNHIRNHCLNLIHFCWKRCPLLCWSDIFEVINSADWSIVHSHILEFSWPKLRSIDLNLTLRESENSFSFLSRHYIGIASMVLCLFPNAKKLRLRFVFHDDYLNGFLSVLPFIQQVEHLVLATRYCVYSYDLLYRIVGNLPKLKKFQIQGQVNGNRMSIIQKMNCAYPRLYLELADERESDLCGFNEFEDRDSSSFMTTDDTDDVADIAMQDVANMIAIILSNAPVDDSDCQ